MLLLRQKLSVSVLTQLQLLRQCADVIACDAFLILLSHQTVQDFMHEYYNDAYLAKMTMESYPDGYGTGCFWIQHAPCMIYIIIT